MSVRSRLVRGGSVIMTLILVAGLIMGCSGPEADPRPTPSPTPKRLFTIMTTDRIRTADPAAVAETGSTMLTQNVFQRLMTVDPTVGQLKPDAAQDCVVEARTTIECTLKPDLKFSNGDPMTAADVEFSIQRAARLDVPGSSAGLLSSLRRIETPDDRTVRFLLSRYDTQFTWALTTPAASIVNSRVYNPDRVQELDDPIIGSGQFKVNKITKDTVELGKYLAYVGYAPAQVGNAVLRTMPDSASIEEAMKNHEVDVVWRGLSDAAQERLETQIATSPDSVSKSGFKQVVLPGARVQQLIWNPASKHRESDDLRDAIAGGLQEDRTLDSVVPSGIPGHRPSFEIGGQAKIDITWSSRVQLTLSYDPTSPDSLDLATQIRTRLEETGGLSVLLRPGDPDADLHLVDRKAWTSTGIAWLQPVLADPLPDEAESIAEAEDAARRAGNQTPQLASALADLQAAAARENVVLPISQQNEYVYAGPKTTVSPNTFGPGWQLGLWGMTVDR